MTRPDKKFCGSIGVRFGTILMNNDLSPAENHGGPAGRFRVRLDRRWYDLEDQKLFLCADERDAALIRDRDAMALSLIHI